MLRFVKLVMVMAMVTAMGFTGVQAKGNPHNHGAATGNEGVTVSGTFGPAPFLDFGREEYTIGGDGFAPSTAIGYTMANPGCCLMTYVYSDAFGAFAITRPTGTPGTYYFTFFDMGTMETLASISFEVTP